MIIPRTITSVRGIFISLSLLNSFSYVLNSFRSTLNDFSGSASI